MNTKLYVGNLSDNTSEAVLRELFSKAGNIVSYTRPVDRTSRLLRDFAFVEMATAEEAGKAIHLLNGHEVDGRAIKVSEVRSQLRDVGRSGFDKSGGRHGQDQFIRGNSRSGAGRRSGNR